MKSMPTYKTQRKKLYVQELTSARKKLFTNQERAEQKLSFFFKEKLENHFKDKDAVTNLLTTMRNK